MRAIETYPTRVRTRLKASGLPAGFIGSQLDDMQAMPGVASRYLTAFEEGKVLRATGEPTTCGYGLWFRGNAGGAIHLYAAMVERLLVTGNVDSVRYYPVEALLETQKPGFEKVPHWIDPREVDLLIIAGLGSEYRTETGWAKTTLGSLITARWTAGLPTWVVSKFASTDLADDYQLFVTPFVDGAIIGK